MSTGPIHSHVPAPPLQVPVARERDEKNYVKHVAQQLFAVAAPVVIVRGTHVVALCGEVFPVTKAAKPGSPVCPDCQRIYQSLKKG